MERLDDRLWRDGVFEAFLAGGVHDRQLPHQHIRFERDVLGLGEGEGGRTELLGKGMLYVLALRLSFSSVGTTSRSLNIRVVPTNHHPPPLQFP